MEREREKRGHGDRGSVMNYITIWELGWGRRVEREESHWREAERETRVVTMPMGKFINVYM